MENKVIIFISSYHIDGLLNFENCFEAVRRHRNTADDSSAFALKGTLGGSENRNTAKKKIAEYRNTTIPCRNSIKLEQITRKQKLRFGNVLFKQNKQNKEHRACWLIINKK